jgi:ABC-type transporter Mla MlaB component
MSQHFVVVADNGHLKFYQMRKEPEQMAAALDLVQALDFPAGKKNYTAEEADMAGRFQSSKHQTNAPGSPVARTGMSIDERLPLAREVERKRVRDLAQAIEAFLQKHADATWDFAGAPAIHNATLNALPDAVRNRLQKSLAKDLVNQPPTLVRDQFFKG